MKYKIIKKSDSLGPLPYPVGTVVEGYPWLRFVGIKLPKGIELYYYDNDCFIELKEEHYEEQI